jgi:hypothetical protein
MTTLLTNKPAIQSFESRDNGVRDDVDRRTNAEVLEYDSTTAIRGAYWQYTSGLSLLLLCQRLKQLGE